MKREGKDLAELMFGELKDVQQRTHPHQQQLGPIGTRGWKVKRRGTYFVGDANHNDMYGMFLGEHEGKFVVGVLNLGSKRDFNATESFNSADELMSHWVVE